jgi:predicted ATPase/DNA-binding CsgD family transcriptional regulator/DNA-binding XRE family transcriptional regulator
MSPERSFGKWIKRRRKALDLTQASLARQIGCSVSALEKIEAGQRRPSQQLAERLADILKLTAADRATFLQQARTDTNIVPPDLAPTNLPIAQTSFVGREQECAQLRALLRQDGVRLLTLTGPGGVGKTRLALQVAGDLRGDFRDGVWFVALADLAHASDVAIAIARTIDAKPTSSQPVIDQLQAHLRESNSLLILDNFEHVLAAAPLLAQLLAAAPQLKLLVTSRVPLHLPEEHEVIVDPLPVPHGSRQPSLPVVAQCPAIALFAARAQRMAPEFALTHQNAAAVVAICTHLDGLPLAIELAAARSRLFAPAALLERLSSRLHVLTGGSAELHPRQRTLQATLAWSYDSLSPAEQQLFGRLAVFVGGCTVEAAEAVCEGWGMGDRGWDATTQTPLPHSASRILDGLAALLDQSILTQACGRDGESRLVMLETIREYALEQLAVRGEIAPMRQKHAAYYLALVEAAEPALAGAGQAEAIERLEANYPNIRAALHWAVDQADATLAVRLCGALIELWDTRGYTHEGRSWLARALALPGAVPDALRAKALKGASWLAWTQADYSHAQTYSHAGLALFETLGDLVGQARSLNQLGLIAWRQANFALAHDHFTQSLQLHRSAGTPEQCARVLNNLGMVARARGEYMQALSLYAESLAILRQSGDHHSVAGVLGNMGTVALDQCDLQSATQWFAESLALWRRLGTKVGVARMLQGLGVAALEQRELAKAHAFNTESLQLFREIDSPVGAAHALGNLGEVLLRSGDVNQAAAHYSESMRLFQSIGNQDGIVALLESYAELAAYQQEWERALRLYGSAEVIRVHIGSPQSPRERVRHVHHIATARAHLTIDDQTAAWEAGQALTAEAAVDYALQTRPATRTERVAVPEQRSHAEPVDAGGGFQCELTQRETEIVCLVAQGLTDRDIASQLAISPRTVDTHLRRIFSKVHVTSRAGLAAWAVRHNLPAQSPGIT